MSYRWRAHTTDTDIRSKLHGFAGDQPLLQRPQLPACWRWHPKPRPPARRRLAQSARRTHSRRRVCRRRTCCASQPAASRSQAPTPAAMHLPRTAALRARRPLLAPALRRPARRAPSGPPPQPARPTGCRPRRLGSSPRGGGRGAGPTPAGGRPSSESALTASEALTLAAAALADILSLSSAARGSSDPKLRATSPPAPHATDQINISPERAVLGAGAAAEARPTGRGLNSDKSPGSARPPRPGLLRGARPAGASLRVRPLARPPKALTAQTRRPRSLATGVPTVRPVAPQKPASARNFPGTSRREGTQRPQAEPAPATAGSHANLPARPTEHARLCGGGATVGVGPWWGRGRCGAGRAARGPLPPEVRPQSRKEKPSSRSTWWTVSAGMRVFLFVFIKGPAEMTPKEKAPVYQSLFDL